MSISKLSPTRISRSEMCGVFEQIMIPGIMGGLLIPKGMTYLRLAEAIPGLDLPDMEIVAVFRVLEERGFFPEEE